MHNRWKILAPVDLRSQAEARVQHALNVTEALQGDLTLLYVIDGRSKRAKQVEWPRNAMTDNRYYDVRRVVLTGSIPETVGRHADDLGADLVTVTSGSYPWWNRLRRRSAAADIATATDRPVFFARLAAGPGPRHRFAIYSVSGRAGWYRRSVDPVQRRSRAAL